MHIAKKYDNMEEKDKGSRREQQHATSKLAATPFTALYLHEWRMAFSTPKSYYSDHLWCTTVKVAKQDLRKYKIEVLVIGREIGNSVFSCCLYNVQ